ncbi:MAG: hypothetical protein KatS3mg114_0728 [Planctomycetaceae bacterium]|nr:MAG: hypothetical protein KatS3mg114_0728 [Planctomycetaceae bacterium]
MQLPVSLNRQQILLIITLVLIAIWQGGGFVVNLVFGPFSSRAEQRAELEQKVADQKQQQAAVERARQELIGWRARSLPLDPKPTGTTTRQRGPDALVAQSMYQKWVTDLTTIAGFQDAKVTPAGSRPVVKLKNQRSADAAAWVAVSVTVEAYVTYTELMTFLDHFHRANLLHRITQLKIDSRETTGDPSMKVTLQAEALALADVLPRKTLLPETRLKSEISATENVLHVTGVEGFPKKPPFRVRIESEYVTVTATQGTAWVVERGSERTRPSRHPAEALVELTPLHPQRPSLSVEEFRALLKHNPFIKPQPPREYKLELEPLGESVVTRGERWQTSLAVRGYDPTLGRPEFAFKKPPPQGLTLDSSGRLSWVPPADLAAGTYPVEIVIKHPNAPQGELTARLTLKLREPNTPPALTLPPPPVAYIGRPWRMPVQPSDQETPSERLQVRLGENSPQGLMLVNSPSWELVWTPPETLPPGHYAVTVIVTDDGNPARSTSARCDITVEDDLAAFTRLTGIIRAQEQTQAQIYNLLQNRTSYLQIGESLEISDVQGRVVEMRAQQVVLEIGEERWIWPLGRTLRELQPEQLTRRHQAEPPL